MMVIRPYSVLIVVGFLNIFFKTRLLANQERKKEGLILSNSRLPIIVIVDPPFISINLPFESCHWIYYFCSVQPKSCSLL